MLGKSEFIAEYEKVPAYFAILHYLHTTTPLPRIVTPIGLKRAIEAQTECRVTALSLEKALRHEETSDLKLARHLSGSGNEANFQISPEAFELIYIPYANVERNLVWRLKNIGVAELKNDLSKARRKAVADFNDLRREDERAPLVNDPFMESAFDGIRGSLKHLQTPHHQRVMGISNEGAAPINWPMWGVIVALVLGLITIAIMKDWL